MRGLVDASAEVLVDYGLWGGLADLIVDHDLEHLKTINKSLMNSLQRHACRTTTTTTQNPVTATPPITTTGGRHVHGTSWWS